MEWQVIVERGVSWHRLESIEAEARSAILTDKSKKILILSEPEPTYTFGRNSNPHDLLWTRNQLEASGATVSAVARGGKWTYHGPGQLLVFPILHLPSHGYQRFGVRLFMERFRRAAQDGLKRMGIVTEPGENPFGLFIDGAKTASFGLSFKNGVSAHGMAVYVTPQHQAFEAIHPCGIVEATTTSLVEQRSHASWEDVAGNITESVKIGLISN